MDFSNFCNPGSTELFIMFDGPDGSNQHDRVTAFGDVVSGFNPEACVK